MAVFSSVVMLLAGCSILLAACLKLHRQHTVENFLQLGGLITWVVVFVLIFFFQQYLLEYVPKGEHSGFLNPKPAFHIAEGLRQMGMVSFAAGFVLEAIKQWKSRRRE